METGSRATAEPGACLAAPIALTMMDAGVYEGTATAMEISATPQA